MKTKKRSIIGILAFVIVLAISTGCLFGCGGNSYKSVAKSFAEAFKKGDAKKIVSLMPEKVVKKIVKDKFDGDKEDMIDSLQSLLDEFADTEMSYEIGEFEDLDEDKVEELEDEIKSGYDVKLNIEAAKSVEIEFTYDDYEDEGEFILIKVGNSWYLYPGMPWDW